jgi:hypothetical protein
MFWCLRVSLRDVGKGNMQMAELFILVFSVCRQQRVVSSAGCIHLSPQSLQQWPACWLPAGANVKQARREAMKTQQKPLYMIYDMVWYMIWCDMLWYMIWCDIVWYDMLYNMVWYGMIWYGIWYMIHDMVWYDIWYDMVWYMIYDTIWYGMIWYII